MTGFASLAHETDVVVISVTARSVNHRYLDIQIRAPQVLQAIESNVRGLVQQRLARGRIDLTINLEFKVRPAVSVNVDDSLMRALVDAAKRPDVVDAVTGKWEVGDLLRFPQVVTVSESSRPAEEILRAEEEVTRIVEEVVVAVDEMRLKEGEFLEVDLNERITLLNDLVKAEKSWLLSRNNEALLMDRISKLGWSLEVKEWEESWQMKLNDQLEKRWLDKGGIYYDLLLSNGSDSYLRLVERLFERLHDQNITQRLTHKVIVGRLSKLYPID